MVSRIRVLLATLLLAVALVPVASTQTACACSCQGRTFDEAIVSTDLIADITLRKPIRQTSAGEITYDAIVNQVWRGEQRRNIDFTTHSQTTTCGLGDLPDGTTLLVWAHGSDGNYSMTWCAFPTDGGSADEMRARLTQTLGQPVDLTGTAPAPPQVPRWAMVASIAGGAIVLAGIAVTVVATHRRRASAPKDSPRRPI